VDAFASLFIRLVSGLRGRKGGKKKGKGISRKTKWAPYLTFSSRLESEEKRKLKKKERNGTGVSHLSFSIPIADHALNKKGEGGGGGKEEGRLKEG